MPIASPHLAKLSRPSAAGLLPRERLFSVVDAARSSRCLWLSAPAGAGKTSLVSSWIEARKLGVVWYQVDAGDADPAALFHYLGIVAKSVPGKKCRELPHLTPEYLPGLEIFVRRYFEAFFASFKLPPVLVFDNYQDAPPESALHAILDGALHALPPGAQIICLSRDDPPATLARWRVNGDFKMLGFDDLRLTDEEAQGLARMSRTPDLLDTAVVNAAARGWAAGFKLLLQARSDGLDIDVSGEETPQLLFDYFATEVFDKSAPAMQDFLLKTALLPRVTADVARKVSGNAEAAQILTGLHCRRLFTDQRLQAGLAASYEYHPLLRRFLLERARRTLEPAHLAELRSRAAALLEQSGEWDCAADLWLRARDWSSLQRLICMRAPTLLAEGRIATIEAWIDAVPASFLNSAPWLLYWRGSCHGCRDPALGRESLALAYGQFKDSGEMPGAFLALAGILSAYFHQWGDMKPLDPWIAELEELLMASGGIVPPGVEAQVLGGSIGILLRRPDHPLLPDFARRATTLMLALQDEDQRSGLASFVIIFLVWKGELSQARALCAEMARSAPAGAVLMPRSFLSAVMGLVLWQSAEHSAALVELNQALVSASASGVHLFDPFTYLNLAYTELSLGDADAADRALDAGWTAIHPSQQIDILHYGFMRAGALLARGRVREAIVMAQDRLLPLIAMGAPFGVATGRVQLGQMLMLDGQHGEAREHIEQALAFARRMPSAIIEFHSLMALAWSYLDADEPARGLGALNEALAIGSRQNYMNCHPWWIPRVMSRLCARALEEGIEVAYVQRLISTRHLDPPADSPDIEGWPWAVRIRTLGRFGIEREGVPEAACRKESRKPLDLLKLLVAFGGEAVPVTRLCSALWPDAQGDAARNSFDNALHRLRKLLGGDRHVHLHAGGVSLDTATCWTDLAALEACLATADKLPPRTDSAQLLALVERTLALFQGEFLAGEDGLPDVLAARTRVQAKFTRQMGALGARLEAVGCHAQAVLVYQRVVEQQPLAEDVYRRLIACLLALGQRAEAYEAYRRCRAQLSIVLGIPPAAETEALVAPLRNL